MSIIRNVRRLVSYSINSFIIRHFDKKIGKAGPLWSAGYIKYAKAPAEIQNAARSIQSESSVLVDQTALPVLQHIIDLVRDDVVSYLGGDARIDNIYTTRVPPSGQDYRSYSGSWHTDNVGHRLKLYFCIEGYGDVPTCFVPGSHRGLYRPRAVELARFSGKEDFSLRPGEVQLRHETGDITLFDTNGLHRGGYDQCHKMRSILLVDFVDRRKSDLLSGKAAVGPGYSGVASFRIDRQIADHHFGDLLLDPALFVPETDRLYRYAKL